jgi:hypothetical protein
MGFFVTADLFFDEVVGRVLSKKLILTKSWFHIFNDIGCCIISELVALIMQGSIECGLLF